MPNRVNYNNYDNYSDNSDNNNRSRRQNRGQTLNNAILGASVAPLLGISPLLGLGLGAFLLGNNGTTNIININTRRNHNNC